jgi:hypothetical protein
VTPAFGGNGLGTIAPASATVTGGQTASFQVTPDEGSSIASVTGCGGTLSGNTYTTGAINADCQFTATLSLNTYMVTASAGVGGALSPTSQTVDHGTRATFTVTPETGYSIDTVSGCDGSLDGNTYTTGAITSSCVVTANFAPGIAEIRISPVAPTVPLYTTLQLNATAIYVDGTSEDVTETAAWSSADVSIATISTPQPGLLQTEA